MAQYSVGILPLTFAPDTPAAGKYLVSAAAIGYQTQSASVNVSGTDVTVNFLLAP